MKQTNNEQVKEPAKEYRCIMCGKIKNKDEFSQGSLVLNDSREFVPCDTCYDTYDTDELITNVEEILQTQRAILRFDNQEDLDGLINEMGWYIY